MAVTPLGFLAVLAGWTTTEAGRQPWIIYGRLRTADAVAPVSAHAVTLSFLIFFFVYNVLLLSFLWFAARIAIKGPSGEAIDPRAVRPGPDRTSPALVGARPVRPRPADLIPLPGE